MRFPRVRPLPIVGSAATVAVAATVALAVQSTPETATSTPTRPQAMAADDAARRALPTFAGSQPDPRFADITPQAGDRGVPDAEPIGYPEVVAAAAEPARQAPEPTGTVDGSVWDRLAQCESGGNWASTVGQYEGGLQFHPGTWDAYKPSGYPEAAYQASRQQQILVAERVLAEQGWDAWPACSSKLGLR